MTDFQEPPENLEEYDTNLENLKRYTFSRLLIYSKRFSIR